MVNKVFGREKMQLVAKHIHYVHNLSDLLFVCDFTKEM